MAYDEIPTSEVMALLDISDASVISRWVRDGKLTPSRRLGAGPRSAFMFWRTDIEQLADERRQELVDELARLDAARAAS